MNENLLRNYIKIGRETEGTNNDSKRLSNYNKSEKDKEFNKYQNNLDEMITDFKNRK